MKRGEIVAIRRAAHCVEDAASIQTSSSAWNRWQGQGGGVDNGEAKVNRIGAEYPSGGGGGWWDEFSRVSRRSCPTLHTSLYEVTKRYITLDAPATIKSNCCEVQAR